MNELTKFVTAKQRNYTNALHASLQLALYEVVTSLPAPDLTAWRIQPLLAGWKESIDMEVEITREAAASIDTQHLIDLDKQRNRIINLLFGIINTENKYGILDARLAAARRLAILTRTYKDLNRAAYQEQTTQIIGLVGDMQKTQNFNDLKALGLDAYVSSLQSVNEEFKQLYSTRSSLKAQTKLPTAREQRKVSDTIQKRVYKAIEGAFLFVDTDAERERINFLVKLMNQRIEDHRNRYHQSVGISTGKTPNTGNETTPKTNGGTNTNPTWPDGSQRADGE